MERFPDNGPESVLLFSEQLKSFVLTHPETKLKNHPSMAVQQKDTRWLELDLEHQAPVDNYVDFIMEVFQEEPLALPGRQVVVMGQFTELGDDGVTEKHDLLYFIYANGNIRASVMMLNHTGVDVEKKVTFAKLNNEYTGALIDILQKWMQLNAPTQENNVIDIPVREEEI